MSKSEKPRNATLQALFSGRKILGPLGVLGLILVFSAVVRVFASADAVIAATVPAKEVEIVPETVEAPDSAAGQLCTPDTDLQRILDALRQRESHLESRESQTEARIQELLAIEHRVKAEQEELQARRVALEETMALADTAAESDLGQLTAVYERMKPKSAAAHFQAMKPEFAAGFLGRMKPATAADIMAQMDPQFAYAISVFLAGRNANAGQVTNP